MNEVNGETGQGKGRSVPRAAGSVVSRGVVSTCNVLSPNLRSLSVGTKSFYIVLSLAQSWSPIHK